MTHYPCDPCAILAEAREADSGSAFVRGPQGHPQRRIFAGLAADLKIHPNTAPKAIQQLIQEGFLVARPALGLKLVSTKGPIRKLVIDHVEHLSGN